MDTCEEVWKIISRAPCGISEKFILYFTDDLDWYLLCKYQTLTEDLIRTNLNKVNWEMVSQYQKLSEDFIKEFKTFVYWDLIAVHQNLSKKFKNEFVYYIENKVRAGIPFTN